jgi:Tfp pilus assembly protein PilN
MIEINLLPGSDRKRRARLPFPLPKRSGPSKVDPWTAFVAAGWILGIGVVVWLFMSTRSEETRLDGAIREAAADSARYAAIIQSTERLRARRDSIAERLRVIQEIDEGRYIWPHIMDEVSRALPEHTWLTGIDQMQGGPRPSFRIEGRAGNNFVLTRYMNNLEASPFIGRIRLASTTLAVEEQRLVHAFVLEARYQDPPFDLIETVPLLVVED